MLPAARAPSSTPWPPPTPEATAKNFAMNPLVSGMPASESRATAKSRLRPGRTWKRPAQGFQGKEEAGAVGAAYQGGGAQGGGD